MTPDTEHRARLDRALDDTRHPLDRLVAVRQLRSQLDRLERDAVRSARERGASFGAIARGLGLSRQAVHQHYRHLPTTEPESPEDRWWRERRELDRQAEDYFRRARSKAGNPQAPMA